MEKSTIRAQLRNKIFKILFLLGLIRLGLYIPVPGVELDVLTQGQTLNPMFGFAKTLLGNSFLGIGCLGILPYINASIIIQLLTPLFPNLEKLQKEEGELGRLQLSKYTRYLTFIWALGLSTVISFFFIKPIVFDWTVKLGVEIVLALTVGSILSMWFSELITEEGLGNGSSMIIFINIVGGIPNNIGNLRTTLLNNETSLSNLILPLGENLFIYFLIVLIVIVFQEAFKRIEIVSAKQLIAGGSNNLENLTSQKTSFIPLKLNQGGILPLVFSSTLAVVFIYPFQYLINELGLGGSNVETIALTLYSFTVNLVLIVFFSCFYVSVILKPTDMAQNLSKMAYVIPGIKQGGQTTKYLEKIITRLSFLGGLFLAFLTFSPLIVSNVFHLTLFKNLTSLLILIGVITDTTSQITGYLISSRYEEFKKA
jgi:preprotein translocase subunit SecY